MHGLIFDTSQKISFMLLTINLTYLERKKIRKKSYSIRIIKNNWENIMKFDY